MEKRLDRREDDTSSDACICVFLDGSHCRGRGAFDASTPVAC